MSNRPIIAIVAGHSGGHIIPGLTYAKTVRKSAPYPRTVLFSTSNSLDKKIAEADASADRIISLPLTCAPQKKLLPFLRCAWQTVASFALSLWHLYRLKPERVIAMGGYISVPVCIAAWVLRIPVELFELNVIPGKAVNFLAPLASTIHICFEKTKAYLKGNCVLTDYPIRFSELERSVTPRNARYALTLNPDKKTVFIQGGSQGSLFINNLIKLWITTCTDLHENLQIIHQTGSLDKTDWQAFYADHKIPAIVFDYNHDVSLYYCAADVVICRSGAGTLFEVGFFNRHCITIPLETPATDHQTYNGRMIAKLWPDLVSVMYQADIEHNPDYFFHELRVHLAISPVIEHCTQEPYIARNL